jgi:hypothetical protein
VDVEAGRPHRLQHRLRGRRRGGHELHPVGQRLLLGVLRIEQRRHHDRRAAEMGHPVALDRVIDRRSAHLAQADMGARHHRDGPRKAPAVAVEHRQRPQIDGMPAHAAGEHIGDREQIGAAVVIDDALRVSGGAGRVVEADRVPLVGWHLPGEIGIALLEKRLVLDGSQALAGTGIFGIVVIDDERLRLRERERLLDHLCVFAIGDQHLGFGMVEGEGEYRGIEPGVEGVEDGAGHGDPVMGLDHRRGVCQHDRDGVAAPDPGLGEGGREAAGAGVERGIGPTLRAMHDRGIVGKHRGGALEETERRQRLEVRGIAVEVDLVDLGHGESRHGSRAIPKRSGVSIILVLHSCFAFVFCIPILR